MSKNKKRFVPRLRFPEFRDAGGWNSLAGNELFDQISNKTHNSDLPILAITQDLGAVPRNMICYQISVTKTSLESYKIVEIGDFIISLRSFQGGIEYSLYKGICSPAYIILRKKTCIYDYFYKYYFKSFEFIRQMNRNLEGLRDGKMVSFKQFSELILPDPQPEEQQKIADCLSSMDELISLHTQKLNALKDYKKGLMQQLFPAEGEKVPRLRFPEFRDAGEWKKKELCEIAQFFSGGTPSKQNPDYWGGSIPWVSAKSMHDSKISFSDLNITELAIDNGARIAPKGSILILVRGSMLYKRIPIGFATRDLSFNQDVKEIRIDNRVNNYFVLYQLQAFENQLLGKITSTGIGAGKLELDDLKEINIFIPSLLEQRRISNFLSIIEDEIMEYELKIDTLKSHYKGLLQQLFPASHESA